MSDLANYEIIYNPSQNILKIKNGDATLPNTPVIGVVRVTDALTVLHYNELGCMGNTIKLGDGITQFESLPTLNYNSISVIDNLTSTDGTSALSANQGKILNESKINTSDIVDNLTSDSSTKVLSAKQGKELDTKIDTLTTDALYASDVKDNLISTDKNKPLSANQGYVLNNKRATSSDFGFAKAGNNINSLNGELSVNDASTSQSGVVQLSDSISSSSSLFAATSKAVKDTYDAATTVFTGATSLNNGSKGIVPAPEAGDQTSKFLKADGTWSVPSYTVYNRATSSSDGLLSASDKTKLDSIEANANYIIVDSFMSDNSENPVQNKVIKSYIDTEVSGLVNSAPNALDTLQELASALDNDPNFATTMVTALGNKVDKVEGKQLSTNDFTTTLKNKLDGISESANSVSITRSLTTGTKIATITIDGTSTDIFSTNNTEYNEATTAVAGLMSASDKTKLDGIADGANNYMHPTYTARTGKPTENQTVILGESITISQITSDSSGHITNTTDRTITFTHPAYTATTGVETANQTPAFGGSFNISQVISDTTGHITSQTSRTVTIPSEVASSSTNGLMSSTDKSKLDGIANNANNYIHHTQSSIAGKPTANQTPTFGESFTISQVNVDAEGHTTSLTDRTVTIPNSAATDSALGLVKIGSNINNSSGTISVTKNNVLTALEYDSSESGNYVLKKNGSWGRISSSGGSSLDEYTLHITTSGDDTTGTGSSSNPFRTLTGAYNSLLDICGDVTFIIHDGTYSTEESEILCNKSIRTFTIKAYNESSPQVTISISSSDTRASVLNISNAKKFIANNINFTRNGNSTDSTSILTLDCVPFNISDCSFSGAYVGVNAISCNGQLNRCTFTNSYAGFNASGGCTIICNKNIGSDIDHAIVCNGSIVIDYSNTFLGDVTNYVITQFGRVITGTKSEESGVSQSTYEAANDQASLYSYAFIARDTDDSGVIYNASGVIVDDTSTATYGNAYIAPDGDTNTTTEVLASSRLALMAH